MRRATATAVGSFAGAALIVWLRIGGSAVTAASVELPAGLASPTDTAIVDSVTPNPSNIPAPAVPSSASASPSTGGSPSSSVPTLTTTSLTQQSRPTPTPTATRSRRTPTPTPTPTATAAPTQSTPPQTNNGVFVGSAVTNPYGTVQVTMTVENGRIIELAATYPTDGHSGQVNSTAVPQLRQEALTAQSAQIDTVSGATYTSSCYKTSLQAALDQAGM